MENSQLKQLALLDLSILNFSINAAQAGERMPGQGLIICARGARSLLRSDYEIKLTANACIALCSSTNAVNILSACTTKRFLSPRCASTIQIARPAGINR